MAINYIYPPTGETVTKEPWRWVAIYADITGYEDEPDADGNPIPIYNYSQLEQFEVKDGAATFHKFAEIDASRLVEFRLVHDSFNPVTVIIPKDAEPVHFYRHRIIREEFTDNEGEKLVREFRFKLWVIGFRIGKQYWLAFADDRGQVIYSNDYQLFNARQT
jgi:hypothetical protein